jgi:CheY-like chemotaxis protein
MVEPLEETLSLGFEEVGRDLHVLLDRELRLGQLTYEWVDRDPLAPRTPLEFEMLVEPDTTGRVRLRFSVDTGIVLSCLLMMVNDGVINDRLGGSLEEGDGDALAEVGNQIAGSLNKGFKKARPDSTFEIRRGDVFLTGKPGPRLDEAPVLRVSQPYEIEGFPPGSFEFVFEASAAWTLLEADRNGPVAATPPPPVDATVPESAPGGPVAQQTAAGPAPAPGMPLPASPQAAAPGLPGVGAGPCPSTLLLLYETRAEGWSTAEAIHENTGWPIVIQRLDGSARRKLLGGRVSVVVIDTGERKERGLTACRRLVGLISGADLPVFLCAPSWRRDEVRRAIEAGVSGILVKPLDSDRVRDAIGAFAAAG